jgi:hypothetical protein
MWRSVRIAVGSRGLRGRGAYRDPRRREVFLRRGTVRALAFLWGFRRRPPSRIAHSSIRELLEGCGRSLWMLSMHLFDRQDTRALDGPSDDGDILVLEHAGRELR